MKTLIKSTALLFVAALFTTSVFAADKNKVEKEKANQLQSEVSFSPLTKDRGVGIVLNNADKAVVTIADASGNVLAKHSLSGQKGYVLNQLEEGDYIITVSQNKQDVQQTVHVYSDENYNKAVYFVM